MIELCSSVSSNQEGEEEEDEEAEKSFFFLAHKAILAAMLGQEAEKSCNSSPVKKNRSDLVQNTGPKNLAGPASWT